ncbi:MAG: 1-deoxy-D-xylulose-5-phosphate reductoisomerase [Acidimicrobiia bacterium]|nr:1-deoxy-D-xylulose-5-phosphate reductoisomerase [Acidimicrobiia bacterium]
MDGIPGLKPLVVLGATGSIGSQTLEVAERLNLAVAALGARHASPQLEALAQRWPDAKVAVAGASSDERTDVKNRLGDRAMFGPEALVELASLPATTVMNAVVGVAGLPASVAALQANNTLALANKESLVAGGDVVLAALRSGDGELIAVDSEHSALAQCMVGEDPTSVRRVVLTASGGPFRGMSRQDMDSATPSEAMRHPTWEMGPRITVDSATLINKAFEVIEAHHLFDIPYDAIDVVVHPQSIVHGLVEFVDGSLMAHLGQPDMRVPIQYAVTGGQRHPGTGMQFDLTAADLTFEAPDLEAFPALELGYEAGRAGGSAPTVLNAADEVAVAAFLDGRIGFGSIPLVISGALEQIAHSVPKTIEDVLAIDEAARAVASDVIGTSC